MVGDPNPRRRFVLADPKQPIRHQRSVLGTPPRRETGRDRHARRYAGAGQVEDVAAGQPAALAPADAELCGKLRFRGSHIGVYRLRGSFRLSKGRRRDEPHLPDPDLRLRR